jgi:DNA-binding PadR family transcriptional regulator
MRSDIEAFLPLKPVVLQILLALHGAESHGYGVIQSVRTQSGGQVGLSNGAFYRHLAWLLKRELVAESTSRPEDADPRRGVYYRLTELGERVLSAEGGRIRDVLSAIESRGIQPDERIA